VYFRGERLRFPYKKECRRRIQILFQHPEVSFDPKIRLSSSLREPYLFYPACFDGRFTREKLCGFLESYGIYNEHLDRYPSELSGGELQRMALARVMLVRPDFIVLDEPTSMLDVISQAQIIRMLKELQERTGVSYLFISHDYELCRLFCDRILLLEDGRLAEKKEDGPQPSGEEHK
jgi:peptide/nickel transport system ATP-binding protein